MPVVVALLTRWWFASYPMRSELTMAFIIVPHPFGGFNTGVGSCSHVVGCPTGCEASATIPSLGIVALVGSVGFESQSRSHEPHPVVGGTVRPSFRGAVGRWATISVITAWRCYLVCAAWHRDGVCQV
jgi:hypothetical protein